MADTPILQIKDINTHYGVIHVLHGISMEINRGEIVTLIGANGAGKSTLLLTVCGIVPATSGSVTLADKEITKLRSDLIVQEGISLVPEGRRIFSKLSVQENLDMGTYLRRDSDGIKSDMEYVYDLFPVLKERRSQLGGTLSGGEQQMLAISRALMARPKLLLLDEPSLGLAPKLVTQIFHIIEQISKTQQTTIFLVEQNAFQALKIANRGYVMENGRISLSGQADKLLENDDVKRAYLGI